MELSEESLAGASAVEFASVRASSCLASSSFGSFGSADDSVDKPLFFSASAGAEVPAASADSYAGVLPNSALISASAGAGIDIENATSAARTILEIAPSLFIVPPG